MGGQEADRANARRMARAILSEFQDTITAPQEASSVGAQRAPTTYSGVHNWGVHEGGQRQARKGDPPLQSTHIVSREWAQCEHAANPYSHPLMLESRIHARVPRGSEASPSACREAAVRLSTALRCS